MTESEYWNGLIIAISLGAIVGAGLAWWQIRRVSRVLRKEEEMRK